MFPALPDRVIVKSVDLQVVHLPGYFAAVEANRLQF
jgi:hypothetical protein